MPVQVKPPRTRGEILIVEDAPASHRPLSIELTDAGYTVRAAPTGELALWSAKARAPELILIDVQRNDSAAFDLCLRLKQAPALRHVPLMLLSSRHDADAAMRAFGLSDIEIVARPCATEHIVACAGAHLRQGRAQTVHHSERRQLERRARVRGEALGAAAERLEQQVQLGRANEEALRLSAQVFDATQDAIFITDVQGLVVRVNPAFTRITGYSSDEVMGQRLCVMRTLHDGQSVFTIAWAALHRGEQWSGEVMSHHKDGVSCPGQLTVTAARDPDGRLRNAVAVFVDLSERKAEQHLIDFLSYHDALTGLPNRTLARARFDQSLAAAGREGNLVVVLCLDLDRFKGINAAMGHPAGDRALKLVADFLCTCVRPGDTVTRQGGDEFQIIMQDDAALELTMSTAQVILDGVRERLMLDAQHLPLSTSIGIAVSPNDGTSLDELIRNADAALVRAKEQGRDTYQFFTERMNIEIRAKAAMLAQLRGAIARSEFEVYYQPQLCLRTGVIVGAEALLRWDNPLLGRVEPHSFIALAEEIGLIGPIGEWVLERVCGQIKQWQDLGYGQLKVAVNLSARQFEQDGTVTLVESALRRHAINPACLDLEITEGTVMGDPDKAYTALNRLKQIGVQISLDDFGTGYSSLGYLRRFPIDVLKIDKCFVDDLTRSRNDQAIALSVISLAHNLSMKVVAEGVETEAQLAFLAANGCDQMQGNLFSHALPAAGFGALLAEARNLYPG